jgi:hypothetical protein
MKLSEDTARNAEDKKMTPNRDSHEKETHDTLVKIHLPSHVDIELVQANELRHLEIFFALFSIMLSVGSGFGTARALSGPNAVLTASATAFSLTAALFFGMAIYLRSKVYSKNITRSIPMSVFEKD